MSDSDYLTQLQHIVESRKSASPELSYIAKLFNKGRSKIAQKVGEEAVETVIASMGDNPQEVVNESADLLFHLLILLSDAGISIDEVYAELRRREGISGLDEKAARNLRD